MNNKKTLWMNVVLAVLFLCVTLIMFYSGGALQIITAEESFTTLIGFSIFYALAIAPLVVTSSAYSIIKLKYIEQALLVNVFQLIFVAGLAVYAYSEPVSMIKKEMRVAVNVFFLFYAIPSLINLHAFRKMQIK